MRTVSILALCGSALALSAALPACAELARPAASGVAFVNGDLQAVLEGSPEEIVSASLGALKELEVPIVSKETSAVDGKLVGRTALQRKIDITVRRETETASKVSIRVDTFGDEAFSRQILDKIRSKL